MVNKKSLKSICLSCAALLIVLSVTGHTAYAAAGNTGSAAQTKEPAAASEQAGASGNSSGIAAAEQAPLLVEYCQPYLYTDVMADCITLAHRYPDLIHVDSIGKTVDGRQIPHILIGDPKAKEHILIFGGIHAREYMTVQLVMKQAGAFLEALSNTDAAYEGHKYTDLMKDVAIHVCPITNPDGVTISQLGLDGIRTEKVRADVQAIAALDGGGSADYYRQWKSNAEGIDVNRQFDALWKEYKDPKGHPSSSHYKGTTPETTEEAKALVTLTKKFPMKRTISYHEQGGVIYWNFGQEGAFKEECVNFANAISSVTGYSLDGNFQALDSAGYKDWAVTAMQIPSLTIEIGSGTCPLPASQLEGIWNRNRTVLEKTILNMKGE